MKKPIRFIWATAVLSVAWLSIARAQTEVESASATPDSLDQLQAKVEGVDSQVQLIQGDMDKLKKIKLSGYVQTRYEVNELSSDIVNVSGTPAAIKNPNTNRFLIRRGRLKVTYDSSPLSQGVVYFDGNTAGTDQTTTTPKNFAGLGLVRLLEAYLILKDPWTPDHRHFVTVGQIIVPFGFEIERSSSVRELPERSKAENVLFSGERDRGITITNQWAPQLQTVIGLLNGTGINNTDFPTTTPRRGKDFIARARWSEGIFDVAGSAYVGKNVVPLTGANYGHDKTRYGADAQYYYGLPTVGGGSLKAEFYTGHEVNPDSLNALAPGRELTAGKDVSHLATDFVGFYAMLVQNLGEQLQVATRYDSWDPNTDVSHDQYRRVNVGLNYFYDGNTRLSVAYEIPKTDKRSATGGDYHDPKDNIWTFQLQHKF